MNRTQKTILIALALGASACSGLSAQTQPTDVRRVVIGLNATDGLWLGSDQREPHGKLEVANYARERGDLWVPAQSAPTEDRELSVETPRLQSFIGRATPNRL